MLWQSMADNVQLSIKETQIRLFMYTK
jgi:hypothetical protein